MSDDIPANVVVEELAARLRIPAEMWTDVFKLLSRLTLVRKISPVCYQFKEICNENVKCVHIIEMEELDRFCDKLNENDPVANQQLEHLAANKCQLASQFRFQRSWLQMTDERKDKAILRFCPDLFRGCQVEFAPSFGVQHKSLEECLDLLEPTRPVQVFVNLYQDPALKFKEFLRHPTILECDRVNVRQLSFECANSLSLFEPIFDWLHHHHTSSSSPPEMDCGDEQGVRGLIFCYQLINDKDLEWLLNRCVQNFHQSRTPSDSRQFVFSCQRKMTADESENESWLNTRIENPFTGEVLRLERLIMAGPYPTNKYRLRRCLSHQVADERKFYGKLFGPPIFCGDSFCIDDDDDYYGSGMEIPKVVIR